MVRFIAVTSLYVAGFLVSLGVMIWGWGLAPQNWWWIIGGGVVLRGLITVLDFVVKHGE